MIVGSDRYAADTLRGSSRRFHRRPKFVVESEGCAVGRVGPRAQRRQAEITGQSEQGIQRSTRAQGAGGIGDKRGIEADGFKTFAYQGRKGRSGIDSIENDAGVAARDVAGLKTLKSLPVQDHSDAWSDSGCPCRSNGRRKAAGIRRPQG